MASSRPGPGAEEKRSRPGNGAVKPSPWGTPPQHPEMPFNPFVNNSVSLSSPLETARVVLMLPIVCLRVAVFVVCFLVGWLVANVALVGAKDVLTKPFPKWRRNLMLPLKPIARVALWCLGYNWIKVKGKAVSREVAPILISNHVTLVEPIFFFMAHLPMIVTAKENLNIFLAGAIMKALQVVTVDRSSPTSRKDAAGDIRRRAMCNDWPHVLLFPEATTTNGRALVSFRLGAFQPGLPVQPAVVKYPHTNLDPSWVADGIPLPILLIRLMSNFHNQMSVEYLEPLTPTLAEQKDARPFAERCRVVMARALNVTLTEHAFGDVALALAAQKLKLPVGTGNVEFGRMERLFRLSLPEAKAYLHRFKELDITGRGVVSYPEFIQALSFPDSKVSANVFDLFDTNGDGVIDFREFVAGLAFLSHHEEFQKWAKSVSGILGVDQDGKLSAEGAKAALPKLFPGISEAQVDKLLRSLGLDKKDYLTWDDFSNFLKAHPEYLALALASRVDVSS